MVPMSAKTATIAAAQRQVVGMRSRRRLAARVSRAGTAGAGNAALRARSRKRLWRPRSGLAVGSRRRRR